MDDSEPSSTPLHLLLNAITGEAEEAYDFTGDDGHGENRMGHEEGGMEEAPLNLHDMLEDTAYNFSTGDDSSETLAKASAIASAEASDGDNLRRGITQLVTDGAAAAAGTRGSSGGWSTIQVWHPTAAQKSYGKERRLIVPPPFVRISGPILPSITSLTLSSVPVPVIAPAVAVQHVPAPAPSSSQTHRIVPSSSSFTASSPVLRSAFTPTAIEKKGRTREETRRIREAANRTGFGPGWTARGRGMGDMDQDLLKEGITFPSLWVGGGEDKKVKLQGFKLVLEAHTSGAAEGGGGGAEQETQSPSLAHIDPADPPPAIAGALIHQAVSSNSAPSTPWAALSSGLLSIVSKPSIKTSKSRSVSTCFPESASFALWVRINGQSVRTKYMKLDDNAAEARLASRTGKWTPFRFEMIKRAELVGPYHTVDPAEGEADQERVLTYGSIVRLVDIHGGTKSEPVKLVKVEKNEVVLGKAGEDGGADAEHGQPVSELQRIGMVRVDDQGEVVLEGGKRTYLAAPGARLGGGEMREPDEQQSVHTGRRPKRPRAASPVTHSLEDQPAPASPAPKAATPPAPVTLEEAGLDTLNDAELDNAFGLNANLDPVLLDESAVQAAVVAAVEAESPPQAMETAERPAKRLKTRRNALAAAVVAEEEDGGEQTVCTWQSAERRAVEREEKVGAETVKTSVEVEVVQDWMAWLIAGVDNFSHTFFDPSPSPGDTATTPPKSLSPAPRLLLDPIYRPRSNTLQLTLSHFFTKPDLESPPLPLFVYLGTIGPLRASTWRSAQRSTSVKGANQSSTARCLRFDGELSAYTTGDERGEEDPVLSSYPAGSDHVIVVVDLPELAETMRTADLLRAQVDNSMPHSIGHVSGGSGAANIEPEMVDPPHTLNALADYPADNAAPPAWADTVSSFDTAELEVDGNEAIRQALQSVSQAADQEARAELSMADEESQEMLDPELREKEETLDHPAQAPLSTVQLVGGSRPPHISAGHEGAVLGRSPLPILLVRQADELVFGLGRSVVVGRHDEEEGTYEVQVVVS